MQIYLVGGAVRDKQLGRTVKDRDYVVVGATPEQMEARGFHLIGSDFPVFLHPETKEEYALARTERKSGRGYKGFTVYSGADVTLEQDLARRDLTINAMAESPYGELIDPFGGARDLTRRVLRHVSPAFAEDPLRVLRVARFAARFDFSVADETLELMRALVEVGEMETLVAERVWQEWERALGEEHPTRFFEVLRACGALARLFPEIEALFGVPQPPEHHPEIDTGVHTLMVLTQAARLSPDARVRFAALLHDLGKGRTPPSHWPKHHGHEEQGVVLVQALCRRFRVPNEYLDLAVLVTRYHAHCHRAAELRDATLLDTLERLDVFRRRERLDLFLAACEADARGRTSYEQRLYPQADIFRRAFQAANAVDTSALGTGDLSGPAIAAKLRELRLDAIHAVRTAA